MTRAATGREELSPEAGDKLCSPDASASLVFLGSDLKGCARLGGRLQAGLGEGPAMATFYGRMNWKNKSRAVHSSQLLLLMLHLQCVDASRKRPIPMEERE